MGRVRNSGGVGMGLGSPKRRQAPPRPLRARETPRDQSAPSLTSSQHLADGLWKNSAPISICTSATPPATVLPTCHCVPTKHPHLVRDVSHVHEQTLRLNSPRPPSGVECTSKLAASSEIEVPSMSSRLPHKLCTTAVPLPRLTICTCAPSMPS